MYVGTCEEKSVYTNEKNGDKYGNTRWIPMLKYQKGREQDKKKVH